MTSTTDTPASLFSVTHELTPNPATMKFNLSLNIVTDGFECPSFDLSDRSPLAQKLFGFPWTSSVYIGPTFITITKQDWVDWSVLVKPLCDLISDHLRRGEPVSILSPSLHQMDSNETPVVRAIKKFLDNEIRPAVALDGGDIAFVSYENFVLSVKMKGACSGCPSSTMTLKKGIEERLQQLIPEIQEVIAV